MLVLGSVGLGLVFTAFSVGARRWKHGRWPNEGEFVIALSISFGLSLFLITGLLPGFWMIFNYSVCHSPNAPFLDAMCPGPRGGKIDDYILTDVGVTGLMASVAVGLLITMYLTVRGYFKAIFETATTTASASTSPATSQPSGSTSP